MTTLIYGGVVVNEGREYKASVIIQDDRIADVIETNTIPRGDFDNVLNATGSYVLPGIIDSHVHFREPGLTQKANIESESRAAAYGGITSFFEMPNTVPQATNAEELERKFQLASERSHVNYSFFPGATNNNSDFLETLDEKRIPGIKLFMGSSTGNMLVNRRDALDKIFAIAAERNLVVVAHCEDSDIINNNIRKYQELLKTDDPDIKYHPLIRSEKACLESARLGVKLAQKHGSRFHIAHLSTAKELELLGGNITGEACVPHLLFTDADYKRLGTLIKCNPAIKTVNDRSVLRMALRIGLISTISTDHAPHLLDEKHGGASKAVSGMPMVQFSLPVMLSLTNENVLTKTQLVQLMCHNQADLFGVIDRGYIRKGYKADIVIVKPERWKVERNCVQSKCGWSPLEGMNLDWKVIQTLCNGNIIYNVGVFDNTSKGEEIEFGKRKI